MNFCAAGDFVLMVDFNAVSKAAMRFSTLLRFLTSGELRQQKVIIAQ
jgi:hypothetical protein